MSDPFNRVDVFVFETTRQAEREFPFHLRPDSVVVMPYAPYGFEWFRGRILRSVHSFVKLTDWYVAEFYMRQATGEERIHYHLHPMGWVELQRCKSAEDVEALLDRQEAMT